MRGLTKRKMHDLLNCPNCAAPIQDDICPYCGSVFLDWAAFDVKRPTFVKIKDRNGMFRLMKIIPHSVYEKWSTAIDEAPEYSIEAEFTCLPFKHPLARDQVVYSILLDPDNADRETKQEFVKGAKENG